jgi:phage host-nuclease inhibitor protein Gam
MENKERAQLEAHYQNEIESIKGEVDRLTDLFEQVLSSKNEKEIFAQPPMKTPSITWGQIQQQNNILCRSPLSREVKLPSPWI